jgi:MoaA/NifB/PqqE/SkfB family radical SAM enzyme
MAGRNTPSYRVDALEHQRAGARDEQPAVRFRQFNLADADDSVSFGSARGEKRLTVMNVFIAVVRRMDPSLASWLVALSGGRVSSLVVRLMRLRRTAGAMLHGSLTPPLPVKLQVETTDLCNLHCVHCKRDKLDEMNTLTMPLETFARLVGDVAPLYVNLAGYGEPLIDRTMISKLALLHRRGIRTSFPTNGTYIRRLKREGLAVELPDVLQLSIDGATKESFEAIRKLGDFDKIIDNYRAICALRADGKTRPNTVIRVLCALQRGNLHDYRAMYRLIGSLRGIDSIGLVPVSYGGANAAQLPVREEVLALHRELDVAIAQAQDAAEKDFYRQWRNVSAQWLAPKNANGSNPEPARAPCTVPWFSAYIDAKRRVYPCCYLTGTQHVMGTLDEDGSGFDEIWSGARYRTFRADLLSARPTLAGCRTCPRNDARVISTLEKVRGLLPGTES